MRVGVFSPGVWDKRQHEILHSFAKGVAKSGVDVFADHVTRIRSCDVAVVFGVGKDAVPNTRFRGAIIAQHRRDGKPVVVIDSGYLRRDRYFAVGLGGLNGRADFRNRGMKPDRWQALGVELAPWRISGAHVVLCGQIPWDAAVQHSDHPGWCRDALAALRRRTGRRIVFRPHPLAQEFDYGVAADEISRRPLAEDLVNCHAVVTFNSNAAVEAVISGVPAFACDQGAMAREVANPCIDDIEWPKGPAREFWAFDLAYAQWTQEEMEDGLPWRHLFR